MPKIIDCKSREKLPRHRKVTKIGTTKMYNPEVQVIPKYHNVVNWEMKLRTLF